LSEERIPERKPENDMPDTAAKKTADKVLVLNVDPAELDEIASSLKSEGFHVVGCGNPRGALGLIRRERPDAVVLEVIMPVMSGFEIAARMQADRRLSRIPILFTTDIQDSNGISEDYFSRPLDLRRLAAAIRKRIATEAGSRR
jgi:two-component system OmpR family response regulator